VTETPQTPEPDDKDWTWVLQRPCPDCGFSTGPDPAAVAEELRASIERWTEVLGRDDAAHRPEAQVWSPLEYGCHVRDVCRVFRDRLRLMLRSDDPEFENWDQDAAALDGRYWESSPKKVAHELSSSASAMAELLETVNQEEWHRTGRRSNGSVFTVETLAWYFLHDDLHHLHDVNG
jgi:hypothetical protein